MSYTEDDRQSDIDRIINAPAHMRELIDKGIYSSSGEVHELLQAAEALQADKRELVEGIRLLHGVYACDNPECDACIRATTLARELMEKHGATQ